MNNASFQKIEEAFVAIWCVLMPVTGTLLIPSIQGTIPAYMLAFSSVLLVLLRIQRGEIPPAVMSYAKCGAIILLAWLFLLVTSQVGLMISDRHDFLDVNMLDPNDAKITFRTSLFTQSLYFTACVLIALYFRYFFKESWMRYIFYGGYFLAGYGIYEWLYFLVFHQSGDFLVNRTFAGGDHTASWSQGINFGGLSLLRIKSTLGEPTFFAGVVLPYLFLSLDYRKAVLSGMLLFTALFSTSTACYIGLASCLFIKSIWTGRIKTTYLVLLGLIAAFLVGIAVFFPETFQNLFLLKFSGDNDSGKVRLNGLMALGDLLDSFTIPNWLFGIGFGYTYLSVFLGVLVNTGLIGLGIFVYALFRPIIFLPAQPESEGLKLALLALAILFALSLSEFFLPSTWTFIGLAHRKLAQLRQARLSPILVDPTLEGLSAVSS